MAKENSSATTAPKISMTTELYYSESNDYSNKEQIFMIQSIPQLQAPSEPVTYGCLESDTEYQTEGRKKAESIQIPILYVSAQHDTLKAFAETKTKLYFMVKLPNSTAPANGKPLIEKFSGTIDISLDAIELDGILQETLTIFKDSSVSEGKWTET